MIYCPTPNKIAHAEKPKTKPVTARAGRRIHSYRCICGAWHVSKKRAKTKRFK